MSKSNTAPRPRAARALAAFAGLAGWAVVGGALVGVVGCNDAAKPDPQAAASASGSANRGSRTAAATPRVDPKTMKEYRVDVCEYGTLTLKHARDAYLASLGGAEPSDKKIPAFGSPAPVAPTPTMPPAASGSGKPADKAPPKAEPKKEPAKAATKPAPKPAAPKAETKPAGSAVAATGSAAPAGSADPKVAERPINVAVRAPHQRNARACKTAASLKDPAMADVDAALAEFAPFAEELAKTIEAAQTYYAKDEHTKDAFAKGKELHKTLVEKFGKLDELWGKVQAAASKQRASGPRDLSKADEGEKLGWAAVEDARALMAPATATWDAAAFKAGREKLEQSIEALKKFGETNTNDAWAKILKPSLEAFLGNVKKAEEKAGDKGIPSAELLPVITSFTSLIEARYRALSRALITKANPTAADGARPPIPRPPAARPAPSGAHDGHDH